MDTAYIDSWLALHANTPGATFGGPGGERLDRILVRATAWMPTEIELVGTERIPINGNDLFPSDHYGVLATLRRH